MRNASITHAYRIPAILAFLAIAAILAFTTIMTVSAQAEAPVWKNAPTGLNVMAGDQAGNLEVAWNPLQPNGKTLSDYRVTWAPDGESFRPNSETDWYAHPTTNEVTVTGLDGGATYQVKVRARYDDNKKSDWSDVISGQAGITTNSPATGQPTIAGTAEVEETLTAGTSAIADDNGLTNTVFSHQWVRSTSGSDADITDATGSTYVVTDADVDKAIKVRVSFTDDDGYSETLTSDATTSVPQTTSTEGDDGNGVLDTWNLVPAGLNAGDEFRLISLSSTNRSATSSNIGDYNKLVQDLAANGHDDIQAYSSGFTAVGCTADDDARDNTNTRFTSSDKGVPIYWMGGNKVADQYQDFYDGSWDDEANHRNESGDDGQDMSRDTNRPWTGCKHDGTEAVSASLGEASVTTGVLNSIVPTSGPIGSNFTVDGRTNRPMYGLSEVFNVIGGPDTLSDLTLEVSPGGEAITLSPSFDADTFTYSATVANEIDEVSMTATKADSLAAVVITGDNDTNTPDTADLDLDVGANTLTVTVTAEDSSTTKTYTINVTRTAAPPPAPTDCPAEATWCSTIKVSYVTGISTGVTTEWWGYAEEHHYGDLRSTEFTRGGTNYTVYGIYRIKHSTTSTITSDTLNISVTPSLPDGTTLKLGDRTFAVNSDSATANDGREQWDVAASPVNWTDGQHVTASLILPGTADEPEEPTNLMATAHGENQIDLEWQAPTNNGGTIISGYKIQHSPDGNSPWTNITSNTGNTDTTYSHTSLNPQTTGYYRVFAINYIGTGPESNVADATTRALDTPSQVMGVVITASNSTLSVEWAPVSDATGYKVQWKSGGQRYKPTREASIISSSTPSYAINGLNNGTEYQVRVIATKTGANDGPPSSDRTGTPTNLSPTVTFGPGRFTASENGRTATVTVEISVAVDVTIPLRVQRQDGASSADYSGVPGSLVFANGTTVRSFTVTAVDDSDNDDDEKIRITFDDLPNGVQTGARSAVNVRLEDNDDGNRAPRFGMDEQILYMIENTPPNQNVGNPITATDGDGDTITYTFGGPDMDRFTFLSSTAQIRTKAGQTYDYETHQEFVVRVTADDGNGGTATATLVINVVDVDED